MLYKFDRERNIILNMLLKFKQLIQRKIFNYFGEKTAKVQGNFNNAIELDTHLFVYITEYSG